MTSEKLRLYCSISDELSSDIIQSVNYNGNYYGEIDLRLLCETVFPSGREVEGGFIEYIFQTSKDWNCNIDTRETKYQEFYSRLACLRDRFKDYKRDVIQPHHAYRARNTFKLALGLLQNCAGDFDDIFDRSLTVYHIKKVRAKINNCKLVSDDVIYPESKLSLLYSHHNIPQPLTTIYPIKPGYIGTYITIVHDSYYYESCFSFDLFISAFSILCSLYTMLRMHTVPMSDSERYDFKLNPGFVVDGRDLDDVALWYGLRDQNFNLNYEIFNLYATIHPENTPKNSDLSLKVITAALSVLRDRDLDLYDRFIEITQRSYFNIYRYEYTNPELEELISSREC